MCKTVMSDAKYLCHNTIKLQSNTQPNFDEILLQKHCILAVKICISKEFFDSDTKMAAPRCILAQFQNCPSVHSSLIPKWPLGAF